MQFALTTTVNKNSASYFVTHYYHVLQYITKKNQKSNSVPCCFIYMLIQIIISYDKHTIFLK
jgi:hypothetical protein